MRNQTIVDLFYDQVASQAERTAVLHRERGEFQQTSWQTLAQEVERVAAGLVQLGIAAGDRVLLLSENRYEWIVCDLAIQAACAIHVPVHAPLTAEQISEQIADSEPSAIFVSTAEQAEKVARCRVTAPVSRRIFSFDPCSVEIHGRPVASFGELGTELREEELAAAPRRAREQLGADSLATILYTSGTTGRPKGVMLTQGNLVSNALATLDAIAHERHDLRLNFLPLSHIFARTCDLYTWIAAGSQLALAESRETVLADCADVKPTVLNAVPFFYERVQRALVEQGVADEEGALHNVFGGRVRLCGSGGAALPDHVFDFYESRGLPILQGYGLSETSPVITISTPAQVRRSSSGRAIRDVAIRIADDGEILTRGPHVMAGYYKNQQATDEMIRDGWLYTGDLGRLDDDGFLFITGRKKELLVTSGGKNVAPVQLESLLTEDPLILQAVVLGDGRDYLTALLVPDPEALQAALSASDLNVASVSEAIVHPTVVTWYEQRVQERLKTVSHFEQVRKFILLERGFSIESGELTPKLSLRRTTIGANYRDQIEAMYAR